MFKRIVTPPRQALAVACFMVLWGAAPALAQSAVEVQVTYTNGAFQPNQISAPADKPMVVRVRNLDAKAMEFESRSLRVEKVVAAKSTGVINVRPLKPGRYEFFDDFNQQARGTLTVQ